MITLYAAITVLSLAFGGYSYNFALETIVTKDKTMTTVYELETQITNLEQRIAVLTKEINENLQKDEAPMLLLQEQLENLKKEQTEFNEYQILWKKCETIGWNTRHKLSMKTENDTNIGQCCITFKEKQMCYSVENVNDLMTLIQMLPPAKGDL